MSKGDTQNVRYRTRADLTLRILAATVAAYGVANVAAIFLSRVMPIGRGPATLVGVLASFAIFAACVIGVFAARTAGRAWLGLTAVFVVSVVGIWMAPP